MLEGEPQSSFSDFNAALRVNKGAHAVITTANTGTTLSTEGLVGGKYNVYATDAAGNISDPINGVITVNELAVLADASITDPNVFGETVAVYPESDDFDLAVINMYKQGEANFGMGFVYKGTDAEDTFEDGDKLYFTCSMYASYVDMDSAINKAEELMGEKLVEETADGALFDGSLSGIQYYVVTVVDPSDVSNITISGTVSAGETGASVGDIGLSLFKGETSAGGTATNSDGTYVLPVSESGEYIIKILAEEGVYDAVDKTVTVEDESVVVDITLAYESGAATKTKLAAPAEDSYDAKAIEPEDVTEVVTDEIPEDDSNAASDDAAVTEE
jgi:hypothetical protein